MEVKSLTWTRDIHDIYDYESKELSQQTLVINTEEQSYLVRNGSQLEITNGSADKPLVGVYKNEQDYFLSFQNFSYDAEGKLKQAEPAYIIVRYLRNPDNTSRGYKLHVGDIFKLGQVSFKVTEIACDPVKQSLKEKQVINAVPTGFDPEAECRYCLEQSNSEQNPLLQVCACKGSVRNIHLECLRKWISSKIRQTIKGTVQSYRWKELKCELCESGLHFKINYDGQTKSLITFPRPQGHYMMIEQVGQKQLHILQLKQKEKLLIVLNDLEMDQGRGQGIDLSINHTTMSRQHAYLALDEQGFVRLHDCKSRFGTLVQIGGHVKVQKTSFLCQVGRSVMGFRLI